MSNRPDETEAGETLKTLRFRNLNHQLYFSSYLECTPVQQAQCLTNTGDTLHESQNPCQKVNETPRDETDQMSTSIRLFYMQFGVDHT